MTHRAPTYFLGDDFYTKLEEFAEKLHAGGSDLFSKEFTKIDEFVKQAKDEDPNRDAHLMRTRAKELYLLEAVAFATYDQVSRQRFNQTKDTLIIMPDCLSLHNPACIKVDDERGDICQQCMMTCQASQVVKLGEKYGSEVYFSKRKLSDQLEHYQEKSGDLAVIGIACIMMLAEGMRKAIELGIPARGVLLSFSGCEHWNDEPVASEFPLRRLHSILKEKYEQGDSATDG